MKVVKTSKGRVSPIDNRGKIVYGKDLRNEQYELIKKFNKAADGDSVEVANQALIKLKEFSKENFHVKIYNDPIGKQGIVDFYDLEYIENSQKLLLKLLEDDSVKKIRLKKESNLSFVFKYSDDNKVTIFNSIASLGYEVVNMDLAFETKPNVVKHLGDSQAQRIRVLALKYKYGNQSEKNDLSGTLESQAFFIDSDGDFCISESGLSDFMKDRFGLATDLNVINNRFLNINIKNIGGSISVKNFSEIEKYFSDLEKRFEISTFVDTNKYQITIDSVLDIGLYN